MRQQYGGGRAGDPHHIVVLGHPISRIAEALGMLSEVDRLPQSETDVAPFGNGTEVKNRKRDHYLKMGLLQNHGTTQDRVRRSLAMAGLH